MMNSDFLEDFKERFEKVKSIGWYDTNEYNVRKNDDGFIGQIFERLMGITENNLRSPDFGDIEIKTTRRLTNSMVTLFSESPAYPRRANTFLRDNFGKYEEDFSDKSLHMTLSATQFTNTTEYDFPMKVEVDYPNEKIFIVVKNKDTDEIISRNVYYTFDQIQHQLNSKLKNLALLTVESKKDDDDQSILIKFDKLKLLYNPEVYNFMSMVENGEIKVDLRMGFYHNKESATYGKRHDHGTGFRIPKRNIEKLFNILEV